MPQMSLPRGKYNNCATTEAIFSLNIPGEISLNKCKFINSMLYTYNQDTEVSIQHSTFENDLNFTGPIVLAIDGSEKNISIEQFI